MQVYAINKNSSLKSSINAGDYILNAVSKSEIDNLKDKSESELRYKFKPNLQNQFKQHVAKLIDDNEEIYLIVKKHKTQKIEFIEIKKNKI